MFATLARSNADCWLFTSNRHVNILLLDIFSCLLMSYWCYAINMHTWVYHVFKIVIQINIDHLTKLDIQKNIAQATQSCFDSAQSKIYTLMKKDCYPRFLTSEIYLSLTKRKAPLAMTRRRSRSFVFSDREDNAAAWL